MVIEMDVNIRYELTVIDVATWLCDQCHDSLPQNYTQVKESGAHWLIAKNCGGSIMLIR